MSWGDPDGPCPTCGVNVDPWVHDCPIYPMPDEDESEAPR